MVEVLVELRCQLVLGCDLLSLGSDSIPEVCLLYLLPFLDTLFALEEVAIACVFLFDFIGELYLYVDPTVDDPLDWLGLLQRLA